MNRRSLLQLFGIGSAVVPLVNGMPEISAPAKLIEELKLEPIELPKFVSTHSLAGTGVSNLMGLGPQPVGITLIVKTADGKEFQLNAKSFITKVDLGTVSMPYENTMLMRKYVQSVSWNVDGTFYGDPRDLAGKWTRTK